MKKILIIIASLIALYLLGIFTLRYLIEHGYTNSSSQAELIFPTATIDDIPASNTTVHDYIADHPRDKTAIIQAYVYLNWTGSTNTKWFPSDVEQNPAFKFIMEGIPKRADFIKSVQDTSKSLDIDSDLVLASLLGEQIRIAVKWLRWELKDILIHSTPTLLRSYNISLGIGGIKLTTAREIMKDAIAYGYGDMIEENKNASDSRLTQILTESDYRQGVYPTLLVKNILERRSLSWYDISSNPWVVGTLYNMGNHKDKLPNPHPQIGWSIIQIGKHRYTYGGISLWIYRYLKIYDHINKS